MKRKKYVYIFITFCLLAFLSSYAGNKESLVTIDKISVQHGVLNTKIRLTSNAPLSVAQTYYSPNMPSTVVIHLNRVNTANDPQIVLHESPLVKKIEVERAEENTLTLFAALHERVPYRIYSEQDSTVVELNNIQRREGGYLFDPQIREKLNQGSKSEIFFKEIDILEENERIDIAAKLTGRAVYQVFALEKPLRLVVDLFDTFYLKSNSVYPVKKGGIEKVRMAQFKMSNPYTITRIVFDLTEPRFYALNFENDKLTLSFLKNRIPQSVPGNIPSLPLRSEPSPPEEAISMRLNKSDQQAEPNDKDTEPASSEEAPPPKVQPTESNPAARYQEQEDQYKPKTIAQPEEKYTGEILSLKFKDADLRDVILYLGDFAGLNVVFDPEVRGTVTCDLEDVPWDQALDIILKINKMGKTIERNVLRIAPIRVLTREDEEQRRLRESKELAGPTITKTYTLSYSKAKDVQQLMQTKISGRGEIVVDERTNTLIISDVSDRIDLIERLISVLDTPTPQVSIEARIVEATSTFVRNLGIQWGFRGIADPFYGNPTSLQFPNKVLVDGAVIPQGITTKGIGGPLGGYAINLPAPAFNTAVGISFGNILDTFRIDMAISALETSGEGQIISAPTVTTQNNQEAEILQGRQIPVQTVANFTVTTRYVNAALELRATPQITAEGTIIMGIEIRNNAADFANLVNGIPPITMQSASTTVMIPDGGTTVIGGIYRTEDSITREKVPFFHKIPILGNLFRSFARTKQNRELLIFITPRILR